MFKKRMRVSKQTFSFICRKVAPHMQRMDTQMHGAISLEKRVCLALHRLAIGSLLQELGDLYGCATSTSCGIVTDFCSAIRMSGLHDFYIRWLDAGRMEEIASSFEALRDNPFVIGAVDGSHIPIIAPKESPADFYNCKGYHLILLQMIVMADCRVWDYAIGWAGSIHDTVLFSRSALGKACKQGHFGRYRLLEDCAYPTRAYMLPPYKGGKEGLTRETMNWNFVQ
ncbi:hypothetical protein L7F22_048470 [Adiantum nelumboides]|nr:hypothetical protein [Adiantum nelumboides]